MNGGEGIGGKGFAITTGRRQPCRDIVDGFIMRERSQLRRQGQAVAQVRDAGQDSRECRLADQQQREVDSRGVRKFSSRVSVSRTRELSSR